MTNLEAIKSELINFTNENSDGLLRLEVELDVLEKLYTQVAWLHESFEEADHRKADVRLYFDEWSTNLTVITKLLFHVTKGIHDEHDKLRNLNKGIYKLAQSEGGEK